MRWRIVQLPIYYMICLSLSVERLMFAYTCRHQLKDWSSIIRPGWGDLQGSRAQIRAYNASDIPAIMRASTRQWVHMATCCNVLQCVAVCCSVLQCVAVCRSVLQCVAVCCSVLQCDAMRCSALQCAAVCCSVLQCVAVCCSVLQCVAVCCSALQCVAACLSCTSSNVNICAPCDLTHACATSHKAIARVSQHTHACTHTRTRTHTRTHTCVDLI